MELVSLEVENFGCFGASRSFAFKQGLNVLYGPNEAGKSTVARAIRFALLLSPKASAVEEWIPWNGGGDPVITLVFKTGPAHFWRVRKVFGTTTASLDRSSDGAAWTTEARAREVESRIRGLLQWGIPEPGGAGALRGVPESFLANALLADQDMVSAIFDHDLEGDTADSGRARIRAAVQAVATDPRFRSVLDAAQTQVDRAFTATGQRRRGANDPFQRLAAEVKRRQDERDEASKQADESRALAARVAELRKNAADAEGELHKAKLEREALEARRERRRVLDAAAAARLAGQALVDAVAEAERHVQAAQAVLLESTPKLPGLQKAEEDARKTFEAATAEASEAREKRKAENSQEETAILHARNALKERRDSVAAALDRIRADTLLVECGALASEVALLDNELRVLDLVDPWLELRDARKALETAEAREKESARWLARANELRAQAAPEGLPDAASLSKLRTLHGKLEIAEKQLEVGIAVEVKGAPSAVIAIDGGAPSSKVPPIEVEAKASAVISIGGVEVIVKGGRATARADAARLRRAWHDETASLFARLAVPDLDALEERRRASDMLLQEAATADAKRIALGDPTGDKGGLLEKVGALELRLVGADLSAVEIAAGSGAVGARKTRGKKATEREQKNDALVKARTEESGIRARLPLADGGAVPDAAAEQTAIDAACKELDARARRLESAKAALASPEENRGPLEAAALAAKKALDDALTEVAAATSDNNVWTALLNDRRPKTAGIDIVSLSKVEADARSAAAHDGPVDDAAVAAAASKEKAARIKHEGLVSEAGRAEGALVGSGGAAAGERLLELEDALRRAHEKQSQGEDEFEAWRMLLEALRTAESSQATHLGNVLAPDLVQRFQALSGARYTGVGLGPHLGLEGIDAAGGRRDLDRLSIGTQEQLATIFRLCLAERLKSTLLLDDQLVQSDPDRLRWFRGALRATATREVQIIVLTCRPDDYLEPGESPAPNIVCLTQ